MNPRTGYPTLRRALILSALLFALAMLGIAPVAWGADADEAPQLLAITPSFASPTNRTHVSFTLTFSEPVSGLSAANLSLVTSGLSGAAITYISNGGSNYYYVSASTGTGDGALTLNLTSGAGIVDAQGVALANAPVAGPTYIIDKTAPTALAFTRGAASPSNLTSLPFLLAFSEPVVDVNAYGMSVINEAGQQLGNVSLSFNPAANAIHTVTVNNVTGSYYNTGTVGVHMNHHGSIKDLAGNALVGPLLTSEFYTLDKLQPVVTLSRAAGQAQYANSGPFRFRAQFSENVTGFDSADVTLSGVGASGVLVTPLDARTYDIVLDGLLAEGEVRVAVPAGATIDAAGNPSKASFASVSAVYDTTPPTGTIELWAGQPNPTNGLVELVLTFSEPVYSIDESMLLIGGSAAPATVSFYSGMTPEQLFVVLSDFTADGPVSFDLPAGSFADRAGNRNLAPAEVISNSALFDSTPPSVTLSSPEPDPTAASTIPVTAQLSEPVLGFDAAAIQVQNGTLQGFTAVDADTYTFELLPAAPGQVTVQIGAWLFVDMAGNGNLPAQLSRTFSPNTAPVAQPDSYTTAEDTALSVSAATGLLANDADADADSMAVTLHGGPSAGALTLDPDGGFSFTPAPDFAGDVSFVYSAGDGVAESELTTVTITVTPANDAPTAGDDAYSIAQGATLVVPAPGVLANDADIDGDSLGAVLVGGPANGALTLGPDGAFSYIPAAGFAGNDSFTYRAFDGGAGALATVSITVTPATPAPDNSAPSIAIGVGAGGIGQCANSAATATLNLRVADADGPSAGLQLSAVASDDELIPAGGISFGGSGAGRTLTFGVVPGTSERTATLTVRVSDAAGGQASLRIEVYVGTADDNQISTGNRTGVIFGLGGDDTLAGGNAPDLLCGGAGDDSLDGGNGDDSLGGGEGADLLSGAAGNDTLTGGTGADRFAGGRGDDHATDPAAGEPLSEIERTGP